MTFAKGMGKAVLAMLESVELQEVELEV